MPSGFKTRIDRIYGPNLEEIEEAFYPMSVNMTLEDEIDISRGDMISKPNNPPDAGQDISAMICWFSQDSSLQVRGKYILRHTTNEVKAMVREVSYKVDINTLHKIEDDLTMDLNSIGRSLYVLPNHYFSTVIKSTVTGSFILVDEQSNQVAAGMIV